MDGSIEEDFGKANFGLARRKGDSGKNDDGAVIAEPGEFDRLESVVDSYVRSEFSTAHIVPACFSSTRGERGVGMLVAVDVSPYLNTAQGGIGGESECR